MITFMESKETVKETEKCLDSQLWHACAGSMVQMPPMNSKVFYFPQGHAEHVSGNVDYRNFPKIPACVPCTISAIKFMADLETDEVFAKIRLVPISNDVDFDDEGVLGMNGPENQEKPTSFAKTLTQSDANNGGGFSVPRYCAETIFPRLDYTADPPVQTILAKDVHGETWKFRHIYRGTPRRHLLTTGWSTFVNHKKLVAGDSIVFLRAENGDLCVGIRRAKRGIGGGIEIPSGWNPAGGNSTMPYGGFSTFLRDDDENKLARIGNGVGNGSLIGRERVKVETVIEAATLAASGQPFEVIYYPRASTPEFCVKASLVKAALQIRWSSGIRFKMAFETEDSSRISWFMGTISSVQVADPIRWPDSPWRLLQVTWDEPDLLQNVKRVSPWLVELVSNMPAVHLSAFSPPRKKLRLPHQSDLPLDPQLTFPFLSGNNLLLGSSIPFGCRQDNTPAGMQGARHAQYGLSLSDFHLSKLQSGFFPVGFKQAVVSTGTPIPYIATKPSNTENISCSLTMGNSSSKKSDVLKATPFVLFGQPILTEKQMCTSCGSDTVSSIRAGNGSTSPADKTGNTSDGSGSNQNDAPERTSCEGALNLETSQCKVFFESEDMGHTMDLSLVGSFDELYRNLEDMFGVEISDPLNHVLYWDAKGAVKQLGEEPFSNFKMTAKRLRILTKLTQPRERRSVDL